MSFWRRAFPGNRLHWYWQSNTQQQRQIGKTHKNIASISKSFVIMVNNCNYCTQLCWKCDIHNFKHIHIKYQKAQHNTTRHNKTLITKTSELNDCDFIIRNIYKDLYWFSHVLELYAPRPTLLILCMSFMFCNWLRLSTY